MLKSFFNKKGKIILKLKYIEHYPEHIKEQVVQLIKQDKLKSYILNKYKKYKDITYNKYNKYKWLNII